LQLVPFRVLFDKHVVKLAIDYLTSALDLVLPERCPSCGVITPSGGHFCAECWQQLRFLTPPWCASCAAPINFAMDDEQQCASCLSSQPIHDGIRAAVAYSDISRQVVLRMKYGGKIGLAKLIAKHLERYLPTDGAVYHVVPVPLHWTRLWARGFNQSALIAKSIAGRTGHIFCPDMLLRQKRTPLLRGLSGKERRKTVSTAFALNPKAKEQVKGARILLIDDVLTSGATSQACVKALKKSGAEWVQIFCWARVLHGDQDPMLSPFVLDA
jgi:ComF family protein